MWVISFTIINQQSRFYMLDKHWDNNVITIEDVKLLIFNIYFLAYIENMSIWDIECWCIVVSESNV